MSFDSDPEEWYLSDEYTSSESEDEDEELLAALEMMGQGYDTSSEEDSDNSSVLSVFLSSDEEEDESEEEYDEEEEHEEGDAKGVSVSDGKSEVDPPVTIQAPAQVSTQTPVQPAIQTSTQPVAQTPVQPAAQSFAPPRIFMNPTQGSSTTAAPVVTPKIVIQVPTQSTPQQPVQVSAQPTPQIPPQQAPVLKIIDVPPQSGVQPVSERSRMEQMLDYIRKTTVLKDPSRRKMTVE